MAKLSVFVALYIYGLVIHETLKYQLLLSTWKLLLQAFNFVWAVVLWWIDAVCQLSHHLVTPHSGMGQRMRTESFVHPQCSCWGSGVRNRGFIGVRLGSAVTDVLVCYPSVLVMYLKQHHKGCPDESSNLAWSSTNICRSELLAQSDQCLLHPTNTVWVAGSLKHWTCFSIHPVVWIQLNNKPLIWSVWTFPESNQLCLW